MRITPDEIVFYQNGIFKLNATIVMSWIVMLILALSAKLITKNLKPEISVSKWQCFLEMIVISINKQIEDIGLQKPEKYIGFIGTLFLFIFVSNLCTIFPFYEPPTSSLSTTTGLALSVFIAVPFFGIRQKGLAKYLKSYFKPSIIMTPFHIISEITRTIALAVRLFGNMMSGVMILAILLTITPFFFPIFMSILGLLIGSVQAYIFSVLATVFIAAAVRTDSE